MDSEFFSFQGTLDASASFENLPPRQVTAMLPQPIISWTPRRLAAALLAWVLEETRVPAPHDA